MDFKSMINVGMADLKVTRYPDVLTTLGLGSCVGIAVYCTTTKIGGLAHVMLPDSTAIKNNSNIAKFADTATAQMLREMIALGARKATMKAKIAGGAQMFAMDSKNPAMRIGDRNVEASIRALKSHGIPIIGQDTGANYGRTVELYTEDGRFLIKTIGHGNRIL